MNAATETTEYLTDKYGFPMEACDRCDGLGRIESYRHVMGGLCAKCNGSKKYYPKGKAGDLARGFYAELKAQIRAANDDLHIGDVVKAGGAWRTVSAVLPTGRWVGSSMVGALETSRYAKVIQFADGSQVTYLGEWLTRRPKLTAEDARTVAAKAREFYTAVMRPRKSA